MSFHGFIEKREVRMEPGPDGKLVPHVYIEKRPLNAAEAQQYLKEQEKMFSGFDQMFDSMFSGFNGMFSSFKETVSGPPVYSSFLEAMEAVKRQLKAFVKDNDKGQMGRGGRGAH